MLFLRFISAVVLASLFSIGYAEARDGAFTARDPIPLEVFKPRTGMHTACFITINSSDEKTIFTRHLNPSEWDLVELTGASPNGSKTDWFQDACRKKIRCDINVISGHFAGSFFGSSGYTLPLAELESHSCAQDCDGIMSAPKEVYLLGCNTLASKERDHRSPEEYYRLLREDGYSHDLATRVVEDRYGPFGQDNRGKIQRAFSEVPYIYGFHSTSPLGKDSAPLFDSYLRKLGDFTKHIEAIETRGTNADVEPNKVLQTALRGKSFTQCAGLNPADSEYQLHFEICSLYHKSIPLGTRMESVEKMFNHPKVLSLLPAIQHFLRVNLREMKQHHRANFAQLQANTHAKSILLETAGAIRTPLIRVEWLRFAQLFGWISRRELEYAIQDLVNKVFTAASLAAEMGDSLCSLGISGLDEMDFSSVVDKVRVYHFSSTAASAAMGCIGLHRYPAFRDAVAAYYRPRTTVGVSDTLALAQIFSGSAPVLHPTATDLEILARLESLCRTRPLPTSHSLCGKALAKLGAAEQSVIPTLIFLLRTGNPSQQMTYAEAFRMMTARSESLENAMVDVYLGPQPYWYGLENYFIDQPLRSSVNQEKIRHYLMASSSGRRPDAMLLTLREMSLTPTEVDLTFETMRRKPDAVQSVGVLAGHLHLGARAGNALPYFEKVFKHFSFIGATTDRDLAVFYAALKLPVVKTAARTSAPIRNAICSVLNASRRELGYDDFGEIVHRKIPLKTCAELTLELI